MKTPSLVKDYSKLSEANLDLKVQAIILALTDNPNFPTTVPSLADFTALKDAFSAALLAASSRDRNAVAAKNQAKAALVNAARLLGTDIEAQAQGDKVKLVSSGFTLASEGNSPVLAPPSNFMVSDGLNSGEIKLSVKRAAGAIGYAHEYTLEPPTDSTIWISRPGSSREYVFTNLPSGAKLYFRVGAFGAKKQYAYTNVLSRIVQ